MNSDESRTPTPAEEALLEAYLDRIYRHHYYRVSSTTEADVVGAVEGALVTAEVRTALVALRPEHQQLIVLRFVEALARLLAAREIR